MEYWAVVWGTFIMGATGLAIWFKMDVTAFLPRWVVTVAMTIHYYEAVLACLAIVVWHFYHVIFDPDVYPLNTACWDGRVSEEWQKHEHPLEEPARPPKPASIPNPLIRRNDVPSIRGCLSASGFLRQNLGKQVAVTAGMNLRFTMITALGLLGAVSVRADEQLPVLQAGTDIYSNVTVLSVSATDVYFTYNNGKGMANAKLKNLSPDLQKHFHYNPAIASTLEQKQALANVEYRAADYQPADIYGPAATGPPDESRTRPPAVAHASDLTWSTDFSQITGAGQGRWQNGAARLHRFRLVPVVHQV